MIQFGPSFVFHLLQQRFASQQLRRQPEMDLVMLDEEQDREFAAAGDSGPLAVVYDIIIDAVVRLAPSHGEALDIASGSGQLLAKLALTMPEMHFLGTDLSPRMLEVARSSALGYGAQNITWACQDMYELRQLAPRQFDLITWSLAAHHCHRSRDVVRVLNAAHQLLKPGGTFFLFDMVRAKSGATAVAFADMYNQAHGSWFYHDSLDSYKAAFSYDELHQILAQSAFSGARHVQPILGNFFQLAYVASSCNPLPRRSTFLKSASQKLNYWVMRMSFAGQVQ